ncbi:hypothetical protein NM688_g5970 [Phlebia brevispora]|uniref:Uncharacterized protein n=1 Tax=Phlebia brevispora TaxID=194682 RepID=A0ACC1SLS8_9APHY|nr:hypothetical protein NM688_g5970 [Phlebia brevispora]
MARSGTLSASEDENNQPQEPIANKKQPAQPRNEVDSQDILPESTRRLWKASWKQQEIDEEERNKYERQLLSELKRVQKLPSKPKDKNRYHFDDEDNEEHEVESEDEDEEVYVPLFRSLGTVEPKPNVKLSRKRKLMKHRAAEDTDDAEPVVIEDETTQSTARSSSRASSHMSVASSPPPTRSQSPVDMIVDPPADSDKHPESNYNGNKAIRNTKSASTSVKTTGDRAQRKDKIAASDSARLTRRSRSPESEAVPRDKEAKRKRTSSHSPDAPALQCKNSLIVICYTTKDSKMPTKGKPNESDYPECERLLIRNAIKAFLVKIFAECAFPDDDTGPQWASDAWVTVCKMAGRRYYEVDSDCIIRLIRSRAITARGHLRDEYRDLVVSFYKINEDTTKKAKRENNVAHIKQLKEGKPPKFAYKNYDTNPPTYYAEAQFLLLGLQKRIFRDSNSLGTVAPKSFSPMPLPTIAFALTMVEFCLDSWASGELDLKLRYEEKIYSERYKTHLVQLQEWEALNTAVVTNIRTKMFRTILKLGKIPEPEPKKKESAGLSKEAAERARLDLAGRKGDTESEGDDK